MIVENGYILQLSIDEAIRIFDDVYLSRTATRANGKTQRCHNFAAAWLEIRRCIMNERYERYSKLSSELIEGINAALVPDETLLDKIHEEKAKLDFYRSLARERNIL
jgi:hypothetical protein